ncbi:FG-GAP repeat protein, partial [Nostoc sp. FACHB-973]|nr:FG-GAP repeat protein [Nostoc sp. FACHB-973]
GIEGVAEASDGFGSSLKTGDFNNDGFADLAIGVPGEDVGLISNAGTVNILYGSARGLTA